MTTDDASLHPWGRPPCRWHKFGGMISVISTREAYAVCAPDMGASDPGAGFYKTDDRGKHWSVTGSPPGYHFKDGYDAGVIGLFFLDKVHGWYSSRVYLAAGIHWSNPVGLLRATTDGGKTWKSITTSDKDLYDLRFVSLTHGYAHYGWPGAEVASSAWLETYDGGVTWTLLSGRLSSPAYPIFFDAANGITVGGNGEIGAVLRTSDGGQHWSRVGSVATACGKDLVARINNLSFPDANHGWVLADCLGRKGEGLRPIFVRTTDTGKTWVNLPSSTIAQGGGKGEQLRAISFIDGRTGYASTISDFLVTHDGGASFAPTGNPIPWAIYSGTPLSSRWALAFVNRKEGWAAEQFRLFSTVDGGVTWRNVPVDYWMQPMLSVRPGGPVWVLAGKWGSGALEPASLLMTADGGASWTRYQLGDTIPMVMSFADTQHGWMVDQYDYLYRTLDGGANWVLLNGP